MTPLSSRTGFIAIVGLTVMLGTSGLVAASSPASAAPAGTVASSFDGVAIHFRAVGQGAPAVVLIHCWMCDSGIWDNVVPELSRTHRVVTLDLPGHGASGRERKEWTMAAFGADVKSVVEALHLKRVILVGHSMGGPVMLEAARLLPGKVVGMVGVDTLLNAEAKRDPKEIAEFLAKLKADFRGQTQQLVRAISGKAADPSVVARVAEKMSSGDPAIGLALMDNMQHYDMKAAMLAAKAPMVAINATMRPTNVDGNRKLLPRYEMLPLPEGVGHFPQVEAPEAFNRLLAQAIASLTK
jgi:pimeloyl-ACP methyl ester carboxylesterase